MGQPESSAGFRLFSKRPLFQQAARRFLDESPISTASFSEISEKEYFDKTRDLIDELERSSSALLPDDQTEAVRAYITAMRCVGALGDYVSAMEAVNFFSGIKRHPSLSYLLTEERSSTGPKIGCVGYGGLGCVSLILVGIVMSFVMNAIPEELSRTLSSSGLAGMAGALLIVGALFLIGYGVDWVSNKQNRAREEQRRKRNEQGLNALDTYLDMTGQRTVYENLKFRTESSAYFAATGAAEKLRACRFNIDRPRPLDELKQELAFHREVIQSCGPVIDPSFD